MSVTQSSAGSTRPAAPAGVTSADGAAAPATGAGPSPRERVRAIVGRRGDGTPAFWMGNPHHDSWPALVDAFAPGQIVGKDAFLAVRNHLGDDFRWICPEWSSYHHPEGKPIFEIGRKGTSLNSPGAFAETESVQEVDDFPWPNPDYLNFESCLDELRNAGEVYRASGFWAPFFHLVADFFGMDNYFVKMYTHPKVVHAVTKHIVDFYLEANRRFFAVAGDLVDGFFFGNDFGTQLDLLISPEMFREFVFPYFRALTEQGHEHGHQVILHSCGSIYKVIPDLLELGVEALHPLQAKAANMEAERLGAEFGGAVAFIGGIDTQQLLVTGTPDEVTSDVHRVAAALGPNVVVSPSHEALLPNVPPANVEAMARAAKSNR